jgi:hypothetical protein
LIKNPEKYIKEYGKEIQGNPWSSMRESQKIANIKKWAADIERLQEQKSILEGILRERGVSL